jgi:hypothetical protein
MVPRAKSQSRVSLVHSHVVVLVFFTHTVLIFSHRNAITRSVLVSTRRVFHPTPPFATLLGIHLLIFSHTRLETVDDRYGYGTFFSPNCSISSLRCTCLIFQFLWRVSLCHRSPLDNAHHYAFQPYKEQQWRNILLSSCL